MLDTTQILITVIVSITTILLSVIGIQLIVLLKDVRKILKRVNEMIDSIENAGFGISRGYSEMIGFFSGVRNVMKVVDHVSESKSKTTSKTKKK